MLCLRQCQVSPRHTRQLKASNLVPFIRTVFDRTITSSQYREFVNTASERAWTQSFSEEQVLEHGRAKLQSRRDSGTLSDILIEHQRIRIWHSQLEIYFSYCVQALFVGEESLMRSSPEAIRFDVDDNVRSWMRILQMAVEEDNSERLVARDFFFRRG